MKALKNLIFSSPFFSVQIRTGEVKIIWTIQKNYSACHVVDNEVTEFNKADTFIKNIGISVL